MNFLTNWVLLCVLISSDALLYDESDNLINFDSKSFPSSFNNVLNDNWLIEFYHSMCGHCINFAPKFKLFMKDAKHWNKILKFGVVDCSVEKTVCNSQNIKYYPTFMLFYKNLPINLNHDEVSIRKNSVDAIYEDSIGLIESKLNSTILRDHKELTKKFSNVYLLLTGENLVDLKRTFLSYYSRLKYDLYYRDSSLKGFRLKLVGKNTIKSKYFPDLENLYEGLNIYLKEGSQIDRAIIVKEKSNITSSPISLKHIYSTVSPVYNQDIFASIMYAFTNDVTDEKLVEIEDYKILRDFIVQLYHFSGFNENIKESFAHLISSIGNKIKSLRERKKFSKSWINMLESSKFPVFETSWVGCVGSQPHLRKYPCGLWTAFHVLSVNEYIDSEIRHFSSANAPKYFISLREFIRKFFSCKDCAENFQIETSDFVNHTKTSRDLVLYLWRIHNNVNKRLKNKPSDDPKFPKVAFPPFSICPECRKLPNEEWPSKETWIEENVFNYLIRQYSKINIVPFQTQTTLMINNNSSWKFGYISSDISICLLLSVFSSFIVFITFLKFCRDNFFGRTKKSKRWFC